MGRHIEYLDPRWDWIEITTIGTSVPVRIRGQCNHIELVPVKNIVTGELVAWLCGTCDEQLPGEMMEEES